MEFFATLHKVLLEIGCQGPFHESLEKLLQQTARDLHYKRISLAIFDPKTQKIEFSVYVGHQKIPRASYLIGQGITG